MGADVSVVIPIYGRADVLALTLEGLGQQTDPNFTVHLIDQGGSVDPGPFRAKFGRRLALEYLDVPDDTSVGAKRNLGVEQSLGRIIVFLDSDVIPGPALIAAHRAVHRRDDGEDYAAIGYIYGLKGFERDALPTLLTESTYAGLMARLEEVRETVPDERNAYYAKVRDEIMDFRAPWNVFWSGNVSVTRSGFMRAGGFDGHFRGWGYEDVELGYRLYLSNTRFQLARRAWALHYPQPLDVSPRVQEADTNLRYFVEKYPDLDAELYAYYLEPWKNYRPRFDQLEGDALSAEDVAWMEQQGWLWGARVVQLGFEPRLTHWPQITTILEPRTPVYQAIPRSIRGVYHLSGLYCPWRASAFDTAIAAPVWQQYEPRQQVRLVEELLRLAPTAIFLGLSGPSCDTLQESVARQSEWRLSEFAHGRRRAWVVRRRETI